MTNKVKAIVEGKEIRENDVENLLRSLGNDRKKYFQSEEGKKKLLNELINQELFLQDALEKDLDKTKEFEKELERLKETALKQININMLLTNIKITEEEIKDFYEKNKAKFKKQEQVNASHILVDTESKCNEIEQELKNDKLNFAEAAKKYSKCPSKEKDGNLGFFVRGKMVPAFENAAFNMEIDEISNPVKTQFGYHLIKILDKKPASESSFEEVKDSIKSQLISLKQQKAYLSKVDDLKKKYEVKITE